MKGTVVVTGSSGLIGFSLCEVLSEADYHVIGLDRRGPPHPPAHVQSIDFDATSEESVQAAFAQIRKEHGPRIASVVHLAAYYDFSGAPSPKYEELTVQGTARLLRTLKAFEAEQFIFSSTMLIHAPGRPGERIHETSPIRPLWPYPESKVKAEECIAATRGNIRAVSLRIAGVYQDDCHSIPIAQQIQRIYERQLTSRLFPGDVTHGQAFVHLEDVITSITKTIERRLSLPENTAILIGEPLTVTYGELQKTLGFLIHNESWWTLRVPKFFAKIGAWILLKLARGKKTFIQPWMIDRADDHYALDITKARALLGWEPARSLQETLPRMISAFKANPSKWYETNGLN